MRSGPKAIVYQNTLFRISELAWIKVAPLPPWRQAIRWSLILGGIAFFFVVANAKGSYLNLEGLLGLLAWHVGYYLSPQVRLGSCGDVPESYEARGGGGSSKVFSQWVEALNSDPDEHKVVHPTYQYWLNLRRIAWVAPCWLVEWYSLVLIPVFLFYRWVLLQNFDLGNVQILSDIHFLSFENSHSFVFFLCWCLAFLGLAAFLTSVHPGVEVRASGGLSERFPIATQARHELYAKISGNLPTSNSIPEHPKGNLRPAPPTPEPEPQPEAEPVPATAP